MLGGDPRVRQVSLNDCKVVGEQKRPSIWICWKRVKKRAWSTEGCEVGADMFPRTFSKVLKCDGTKLEAKRNQ